MRMEADGKDRGTLNGYYKQQRRGNNDVQGYDVGHKQCLFLGIRQKSEFGLYELSLFGILGQLFSAEFLPQGVDRRQGLIGQAGGHFR